MGEKLRLGVLVSGRGSNLQSIIDAVEGGSLRADIRIVLSDREEAFGLERARRHGIRGEWVDPAPYASREDYDRALVAALREEEVELVALAGFMRVLSPPFIESYQNRIMNIHPALLPSFPGLHVQQKALDHGVRFSGCTVHFADTGVDTGPIIIQAAVPVLDDDTEEDLSQRILKQEHRIYPKAIQLFAEGRIRVKGRRVLVEGIGVDAADGHLVNPPLEG